MREQLRQHPNNLTTVMKEATLKSKEYRMLWTRFQNIHFTNASAGKATTFQEGQVGLLARVSPCLPLTTPLKT
jgi:hypothetical protein